MENGNEIRENLAYQSRKDRTTAKERSLISFFYGGGMKVKAISEMMQLSTKCVYRWIKRFKSDNEPYEPKKPNLQRSMFTEELKNRIKEYVLENRC